MESLQAELLLLVSYRRFPADDKFRLKFVSKALYKFKNRSYWLRRLENHGSKKRVAVDEYTVEHIMQTLMPEWKEAHRYAAGFYQCFLTAMNNATNAHGFEDKGN